jgi:hypothetical protein
MSERLTADSAECAKYDEAIRAAERLKIAQGAPTLRIVGAALTQIYKALRAIAVTRRERDREFLELRARVTTLEAQLEAQTLKWAGGWDIGVQYAPGDVVQHQGSAWRAEIANKGWRPGEPGTESRAWRLVVKRGRDGKDLR